MNLPAWTRTVMPLIAGWILSWLITSYTPASRLVALLVGAGFSQKLLIAGIASLLSFLYWRLALWLGAKFPWLETVLLLSNKRPLYVSHRRRGLGWVRDTADDRDHHITLTAPRAGFPAAFSLRAEMPPVYDQGQLGSCTAHGAAAAFDYDRKAQGKSFEFPARLFIYYFTRLLEGTVGTDSGGQVRDAIKVLKSYGAPPERLWKYVISKFTVHPSAAAVTAAKANEALDYSRVAQTVAAIKTALFVHKRPVVIGFVCYPGLESADTASTGILPMPAPHEQSIGGHCVDVIGYKLINGRPYWEIRNSWGKSWGDAGHFWMPEAYLLNPALASDFWLVETVAA